MVRPQQPPPKGLLGSRPSRPCRLLGRTLRPAGTSCLCLAVGLCPGHAVPHARSLPSSPPATQAEPSDAGLGCCPWNPVGFTAGSYLPSGPPRPQTPARAEVLGSPWLHDPQLCRPPVLDFWASRAPGRAGVAVAMSLKVKASHARARGAGGAVSQHCVTLGGQPV